MHRLSVELGLSPDPAPCPQHILLCQSALCYLSMCDTRAVNDMALASGCMYMGKVWGSHMHLWGFFLVRWRITQEMHSPSTRRLVKNQLVLGPAFTSEWSGPQSGIWASARTVHLWIGWHSLFPARDLLYGSFLQGVGDRPVHTAMHGSDQNTHTFSCSEFVRRTMYLCLLHCEPKDLWGPSIPLLHPYTIGLFLGTTPQF